MRAGRPGVSCKSGPHASVLRLKIYKVSAIWCKASGMRTNRTSGLNHLAQQVIDVIPGYVMYCEAKEGNHLKNFVGVQLTDTEPPEPGPITMAKDVEIVPNRELRRVEMVYTDFQLFTYDYEKIPDPNDPTSREEMRRPIASKRSRRAEAELDRENETKNGQSYDERGIIVTGTTRLFNMTTGNQKR